MLERDGPTRAIPLDVSPPLSFSQIVTKALSGTRGVTFRNYGQGQKRPMFHRFDSSQIKGSVPMRQIWIDSVLGHNALLKRLMRSGVLS